MSTDRLSDSAVLAWPRWLAALLLLAWPPVAAGQRPESSTVRPGPGGRLVYLPDARGDTIPDFSNCGYGGGGIPIPEVPVATTVVPGPGDDGDRIQAAIDRVSSRSPDATGFRGAVLLRRGEYQIAGSLRVSASGVVLRGEGAGRTVLRATGTGRRTLIVVAGEGAWREVAGTRRNIVDTRVPVGARQFHVDSTAGLEVGDTVIVHRPSTQEWIDAIGMNRLDNPWKPGSKDLRFDRVVTAIRGNRITLDAPICNAIEQEYGGGAIYRYRFPGRIRQVGVEDLRGISDHASGTDEDHSWSLIELDRCENAWVRRVDAFHFAYSCVDVRRHAKWVTVEDCGCRAPRSQITGGRRYAFALRGQLTLVQRCDSRDGRHDFVMHSTVPGPNVFLFCAADRAHSDTGPHHRWSAGVLYDNVGIQGNSINIRNRGNSGTGHGWAGANQVLWNCTAHGMICQKPPTAQNWAIGCHARTRSGNGHWEHFGNPVRPRSLYLTQLADRLGRSSRPGITIYPAADAHVRDGSFDRDNYGHSTTLSVKKSGQGFNREAFLRFDLAGTGGEIAGATLRLEVQSLGVSHAHAALFVGDDSWGEPSITWQTRPGASRIIGLWPALEGSPAEIDVTRWARQESEGDGTLSLEIQSAGDVGAEGWSNYCSREAGSSCRPRLIVETAASRLLFTRGDCNQDGLVDISDAICVLLSLFQGGRTRECAAATNANGDLAIDLSDAIYLLNFLYLGGSSPPAPFPHCGPGAGPADSDLGCDGVSPLCR